MLQVIPPKLVHIHEGSLKCLSVVKISFDIQLKQVLFRRYIAFMYRSHNCRVLRMIPKAIPLFGASELTEYHIFFKKLVFWYDRFNETSQVTLIKDRNVRIPGCLSCDTYMCGDKNKILGISVNKLIVSLRVHLLEW